MPTIDEIVSVAVDAARRRPVVLGSYLGYAIKSKFPNVNLKVQFGSLRQFVEKNCSGRIAWIGKHGLDDEYRCEEASTPASSVAVASARFWSVFSDPRLSETLWIRCDTGDLSIAPQTHSESQPWAKIEPLSVDDHRKIVTDFLQNIEPANRPSFEAIAKTPDFWSPWSRELRTHENGKYQEAWLRFRIEQIASGFKDRAISAGAQDKATAAAIAVLEASRKDLRKARTGFEPRRAQYPYPTQLGGASSGSSLQDVAVSAITRMSEDELRSLWLPVGLVTDAIRGRHI